MCGIVSMIARTTGGFTHGDLSAFEQMLVVNTVRGKDSVGSFTKFGNGDVRGIKHGSNPFNLFRTDEWKDYRQAVINRGRFLVGHNRAATSGQVNTDNAHPFVEDHIILVHNGTLRSQNNLTNKTTVVDSNAIAHALAEETGDPRHVLDRIDGAFALIWYNSKEDKLYAARNEERPLVLIESDRHYVLASEAWIAAYPMSKHSLEPKDMTPIKPNELYEFGRLGEFKVTEFNNKSSQRTWTPHQYGGNHRYTACEGEDCPPFDTGSSTKATPEIKSLSQAIQKAQQKEVSQRTNAAPSNVCVLTQQKDTPTERGTDGHTASHTPGEEMSEEGRLSTISIQSEDFPKDLLLTCKIIQMRVMNNGRIKYTGKCTTPGKELVDVSGFLPFEVRVSEQDKWYEFPIVGKIQFVTNTTNGGMTVHLKESRKATMTQTHQASHPIMYWDYAMNHCTCNKCERKIHPWEGVFTSLKLKGILGKTKSGHPINTIEMTCPECILERIPAGPYHDDYQKKYYQAKNAIEGARKARTDAHRITTVQAGEQVSTVLSQRDAEILRLPGPTTIQ
jgi:Glutamine amidotransferase domain